jgi:hypothetical protein
LTEPTRIFINLQPDPVGVGQETAIGVLKATADKPERAKRAYVEPMAAKKGISPFVAKRSPRLYTRTESRMNKLKTSRKNSCSKLDMPVLFRIVANTRMKLNPTAAKTTKI